MKSRRRWLRALLLPAFVWGPVESAFGDGKYFPRAEVDDAPGIAAQRAVVVFRDGVQTLIVQSDVAGADTAYGWILPLPAEPTSIEACAPYSLHGLGQVVRPRVAVPATSALKVVVPLMLVVVIFCIDHVRKSARQVERVSPMPVLVAILITLFLVGFVLLPSLSRARGLVAGSGVELLQTVKVGVYDVGVLKGETAEGVESWLSANGFACPPSATVVIGDYVAKKWCFLAAKVSSENEGTLTHHPLSVTFPASEAVYPMRLTGVDGEPVQLDLYVVGEQQASAPGTRAWSCDVYDGPFPDHRFKGFACEIPPVYKGRTYGFRVGIAAVSERMWTGSVLTRLRGRLDAADMQDDLVLTWDEARPLRATVYGVEEAAGWSAALAILTFTGLFGWFTRTAVVRRWTWTTMLRRRLGTAVVLSLLVGAACYASFDVVPTRDRGRAGFFGPMLRSQVHEYALKMLSEEPSELAFPEAYRAQLVEYGFESLEEAESLEKPGDYTIEADGEGWRLTFLDQHYVPVTVLIGEDGRPRKAGEHADEAEPG